MKFFTIFLVVWGHVVQQTSNLQCWPVQEDPMMRLIYTMHMPLFMGLCGYFFYGSLKKLKTIGNYVRHKLPARLLGLFVPMISFGALKLLCDYAWGKAVPTQILPLLKHWYYAAHGVWFLGDVAVNTVIVLITLLFCKGNFRHDWKYFFIFLPLSMIPYLSYKSPHMYLFFVFGFWIAAYDWQDKIHFFTYWKQGLAVFVLSYLAFSYMPWPPMDFWYDFKYFSMIQLLVNDGLKMILGISGSFLAFVAAHRIEVFIKGNRLYNWMTNQGRFTLDIYLLQIIFVENIFGPTYKLLVHDRSVNWICDYGLLWKTIATFCMGIVLFTLITFIDELLQRNSFFTKILFWKSKN